MKCRDCKYKQNVGNTVETGIALCTYPDSYFPIHIDDACHYIPERKELTCGDCVRLGEDFACFGQVKEDSAVYNGKLCMGFIDKKENEFMDILMFWKVHQFYDRGKINDMLNRFEETYRRLTEQNI